MQETLKIDSWADKMREGLLRSFKSLCHETRGMSFRQAVVQKGAYSYGGVYRSLLHGNPTLHYIERLCTDTGVEFPVLMARALEIAKTL